MFAANPALVLNADFQPLSYFPLSLFNWEDAIKAVVKGSHVVVAEYDWVAELCVSIVEEFGSRCRMPDD
jgi:hypothetical protein